MVADDLAALARKMDQNHSELKSDIAGIDRRPDHGVSAMLGTARRDVNVARESGSQRRQEAGEKRP